MTFNISEFNANINRTGLARPSLFFMRINLSNSLSFLDPVAGMESRRLTFLCRSVELPEINVGITPFKPLGFGPSEKRPTDFDYGPLPTVFMVDGEFNVLKFFHRWMQAVVNYDTDNGLLSENPTDAMLPYEFGYKDEYTASSIEVITYSGAKEDMFYTYKFNNVFPTTVGNVTVAWESTDELMLLPVSFSYDSLTVDGTSRGIISDGIRNTTGVLDYLTELAVYGSEIRSLERPQSIQDAVNLYTDVNRLLGSLK